MSRLPSALHSTQIRISFSQIALRYRELFKPHGIHTGAVRYLPGHQNGLTRFEPAQLFDAIGPCHIALERDLLGATIGLLLLIADNKPDANGLPLEFLDLDYFAGNHGAIHIRCTILLGQEIIHGRTSAAQHVLASSLPVVSSLAAASTIFHGEAHR